ncbi:hypothetical protein [Streptomyces sp. VRA16 Mangrove soil]|uniref:hypothetical protein n=1 Tax=Streptomyces sp. VRA16 Mangrove soil TaxID=2817434 RepID=UPI001A9D8FB1|nr:hypothetical protein [Streptomyces sp. VRA16 Mangrove soil]MBO1336877.1 hypothetical protein [Streptomyces sp. VRA16 Mangrove soil]
MSLSVMDLVGAGLFGWVVGWITYRTLRRAERGARIADIAAVVAAIGGGAVVNTRLAEPDLFAAYGMGLCAGFFAYLLTGLALEGRQAVTDFLGDAPQTPQIPQVPPADGHGPRRTAQDGFLGDEDLDLEKRS